MVMGGDTCSRGRGFEGQQRMAIFHLDLLYKLKCFHEKTGIGRFKKDKDKNHLKYRSEQMY